MLSQEKADSWRFESARKRYLRFQQEYPEAAKRASVNHIASYLLMTPESLSGRECCSLYLHSGIIEVKIAICGDFTVQVIHLYLRQFKKRRSNENRKDYRT